VAEIQKHFRFGMPWSSAIGVAVVVAVIPLVPVGARPRKLRRAWGYRHGMGAP